MTRRETLVTVRELIAEAEKEAAQQFGAATQAVEAAKAKEEMLRTFREEYRERYRSALERGEPFAVLANLRDFLARLDEAITVQSELVREAQERQDAARAEWHATMGRRKAFDLLLERQEAATKQREEKMAQKLLDEWANRRVHRNPDDGGAFS